MRIFRASLGNGKSAPNCDRPVMPRKVLGISLGK